MLISLTKIFYMKINQLSKCAGLGVFFLFANLNAQSSEKLIKNFINSDISFKANANADFKIINEDSSPSLKSNIVNAQQYYNNIPIYKALAKAVIKDGKIISFNNNFHQITNNIGVEKIDKSEALSSALRFLDIKENGFQLMDEKSGDQINLPDNKIASLHFYFQKENRLVPAQLFIINQSRENKSFMTLVSLENGEILDNNNMIIECKFDEDHAANSSSVATNHILSHLNKTPSVSQQNLAATDATYNVFPFPIEAPTFGSRSLVTNPWDLDASPEGWHSSIASNYTDTRGNNVLAYIDNDATNNVNGFSPQSSSSGSLTFDFPFAEGTGLSAYQNKSSAVTNLFYANNIIHDIMYKFGFTEASRNFQTNNFGKGGIGNDAVRAEAFDGSGYNNANFNAGFEISQNNLQAPRMQMFLWNYNVPLKQRLFYTDPALADRPAVNSANVFYGSSGGTGYYVGKNLMETGVTGNVAIPNVANGCSAIESGSLSGKIALITYSGCTFDTKVRNAQNAGAVGVIFHRTISSVADQYVATAADIHIPAIILGNAESTFITNEIGAGNTINVTLKDLGVGYKNSSFDNGIMIHEYGHGISNRLTGQGYSCLNNLEQMGEGWSDFFALMLTNTAAYNENTARGIGTYSVNSAPTAGGIRQYRYTYDMTVNPHTYADTNSTGGQPHAVGEIWATMLWDLHWKMAEKYGYNYDVTANPNSGSAKTLQLVMDGLKLQPCNPNFVSGRDAILQADLLAGGADNCLIWNVFARRGLGLNASAGSATNITDQVQNFEVPVGCVLATDDILKNKGYGIYPNPAKGEFFIKAAPTVGNVSIKVELLDLTGKLVKSVERNKNSAEAISTRGLSKGTYLVVITENGKSTAQKLIVE